MKSVGFVALMFIVHSLMIGAGLSHLVSTQTLEVEGHLRDACELTWKSSRQPTTLAVERCVKRAMSAMSDESRLRDNELKRLLMASERELLACRDRIE